MLLVMFTSAVTVQGTVDRELSSRGDPQDVTITCPSSVTYELRSIDGWNSGMDGMKRIAFESASAQGRTIFCTYEVNNGLNRVSATLQKPMPLGLVCAVYIAGSKSRSFVCRRPIPLTIKPKSN